MIRRYLLCWPLLAVVAVANGVLREFTYAGMVSELTAHQVSTLTGMLLTGLLVWGLNRVWAIESPRQAWTIGAGWLILTVAFEFGFGHFVAGHSWERLLADYNVFNGRVWPVFLIWIAIMPYIFYKLGENA